MEGSTNDWIAVAMVDDYGTSEALGAIGFGLFVSAMTVGRLIGGSALERFGRVAVFRATAVITQTGLLLVLLGGSTAVALVGASLRFPVGMSAGRRRPGKGGRPDVHGELDRLRRVPRRSTAHLPVSRKCGDPASAVRRARRTRPRPPGIGCVAAARRSGRRSSSHCCIKAKGVLAVSQGRETDPSGTWKTVTTKHPKACCVACGRAGRPGLLRPGMGAAVAMLDA
jgi:hypothetical protein